MIRKFHSVSLTVSSSLIILGCENTKEIRKIDVGGYASSEYVADQVDVVLDIETNGLTASEAMDANKKSLQSTMKIIESASAFVKSIQKNTTQFGEKSSWMNEEKKREGFFAHTTISFVANDISKNDSIARLFADIPGASIRSSEFSLSNEIEKRGSVRKTALKRAEEKAAFMADCLGMKLGLPLNIVEKEVWRAPSGPSAVMQNSVAEVLDAPSSGTISVDASVQVEFEIFPK